MLIRAVGLGHRFNTQAWLFRDLDFTIRSGEIVCVAGPSGSGKSTLLALLAASLSPMQGTLERQPDLRVGWVLQRAFGVPERTAIDHVSIAYAIRGLALEDAFAAAAVTLHKLGLGHRLHHPFAHLSGGERQRVMVARAIGADHDLLLLDEPTAQLDALSANRIAEVIAALRSTVRGVVVATHDPRIIVEADRVINI